MRDKSCLDVSRVAGGGEIPDYHPTSLKQAKQQIKDHCIGMTSTASLLGLRIRLDHLTDYEKDKFDAFTEKVCDSTIKKWNKAKKK